MSQPGEIVLASYPYDDFTSQKIRPVLCLSKSIGPYRRVIVSYITSKVSSVQLPSEVVLTKGRKGFAQTGLKVPSTILLHRLISVPEGDFKRKLGSISSDQHQIIKKKLAELLELH